ncbi:MAG: hypothetical protein JXO72_12960 [Vicinamibacteria bacterium]|nr:hypothetical protein [Vicinamibacteria bacterium]
MKQHMSSWRMGIGAATLVCAGFGLAWAKPAPTPATRLEIKNKVDLAIPVNGMKATKTGVAGTDHKVRIDVTVRATTRSMLKICSGPFKVKVESTEDPTTGTWNLVGTAGIADICVGGAKVAKSEKRSFNDTVPAGSFRKYRATIDFLDQVNESNETNNVESIGYVAH